MTHPNVPPIPDYDKHAYKTELERLQIELVRLQHAVIADDRKVLVIFEGRDAGGKDGMIKTITEHMSPRETRVVALGKPSDRDRTSWYFQRYVPLLPSGGEIVFFNRSWYNRAGVEKVMGFCTSDEHTQFLRTVSRFEEMLIEAGITVLKYYLDISRGEQEKRLQARREDPLKQWKLSPIDQKAIELFDEYTLARDEMLARSHTVEAPWTIVRADKKRTARIHVLRDLLSRIDYAEASETLPTGRVDLPDRMVVFPYDEVYKMPGLLAR